jgi:hypothetical protein
MQGKKYWACLADFKKHLEQTGSEKLVSFNGFEIITDKAKYGLAFGEVSRRPHRTGVKQE